MELVDYYGDEQLFKSAVINDVTVKDDIITLIFDIGVIEIRHDQQCCEEVTLVDYDYLDCLIGGKLIEIDIKSEEWTYNGSIAGYSYGLIKSDKYTGEFRFQGESNGYDEIKAEIHYQIEKKSII